MACVNEAVEAARERAREELVRVLDSGKKRPYHRYGRGQKLHSYARGTTAQTADRAQRSTDYCGVFQPRATRRRADFAVPGRFNGTVPRVGPSQLLESAQPLTVSSQTSGARGPWLSATDVSLVIQWMQAMSDDGRNRRGSCRRWRTRGHRRLVASRGQRHRSRISPRLAARRPEPAAAPAAGRRTGCADPIRVPGPPAQPER